MLADSVASTSIDNPVPVDEDSKDFEILLLVIVGRGEEATKRVTTWNQAEKLYRMGDKYQIDGPRLWFSRICAKCAAEDPWEAIFLACNTSPMDTDIIKSAIAEGFSGNLTKVCDSRYFKKMETTAAGTRCCSTFEVANVTTLFGFKLGLSGLLAYRLTFPGNSLTTAAPGEATTRTWENLAQQFVRNVKVVESIRTTVCLQYLFSSTVSIQGVLIDNF
jgi:hypothetical protein